jgi:hypothetical protein
MVCSDPPDICSVPIAEAVQRIRAVRPNGSAVQAARAMGISFGDYAHAINPFRAP